MQDLNNNTINQILNNFKEISKLYLTLENINKNGNNILTAVSKHQLTIYTSEKNIKKPYYSNKAFTVLSMLLNSNTLVNVKLKCETNEYDIGKKELSLLAGYIESIDHPHLSFEKALFECRFHLAHYLSTIQKTDEILLAKAYLMTGFIEDAIKILEGKNDEKYIIELARIYREIGDIKKAISLLSNLKSKDLEAERNIEYGWLHFEAKNFANSHKIFSYYKDGIQDTLAANVLYGFAISTLNINEKDFTLAIESLKKAAEIESIYKLKILEKMALVYIDMKDYIKAYECFQKIHSISPSAKILSNLAFCDFAISRINTAIKETYECGVFEPDLAARLMANAEFKKATKTYPETFFIQEEKSAENPDEIIEAVLTPEETIKSPKTSTIKIEKETKQSLRFDLSGISGEKDFLSVLSSEAFSFSKTIEEEFNKKIYFNYEGLDDIERKIRITYMSEIQAQEKTSIIKGASSFIMFFVKERFKANIIAYNDLDIWAWPAIIRNKNEKEIVTYPASRIWQVWWANALPEQGWLRKYIEYINEFMNSTGETLSGKDAILNKKKSHPQAIFDAQMEHNKLILISQDIEETSNIPHNSSAIIKLEKEIRKRYKPNVPPTRDGWRILRCYAHIFLEMILKDFHLEWYNVEKNDGLWSFSLSNSFIFPIGKVYKAASYGESLMEYYEILLKNFKKR
ncbi:MAG: hypothetical protein K6357_05620 [Elusimicrobiota bacterium]